MVRTKVFVGNLSFNTRDNELAKEFEVAGKVISANIITRGPRSLGYGFVEMDNETDAENAVKMLDKKEIDGRPINVEVAKPREEGADDAQSANAQGSARSQSTRGGRAPRGPRPPRTEGSQQSGAPRSRPQGQQQQGQSSAPQGQGQGSNSSQYRRRRSDEEGEGARGPRAPRAPRAPRPPRTEGEADNRTPSKTTLFVANLPFSIEDDTFAKVLKDASLAYKTAHVVKKRTGRSKGFGFIEFDNESDQQKALASLNNKDLEGRPLAVKVALTELRTEDIQSQSTSAPAKSSSPAPAKAASTSAPAKTSSPAPTKAATSSSPAPAKTSSPAPTKTTTQSPKTEKK